MENNSGNPDASSIARSYVEEITALMEKNSKWWSEVDGETDEAFGIAIDESLKSAERLSKSQSKVLETRIANFKEKVEKVIESAEALIRFYGEHNTRSRDIVMSFKEVAERHLTEFEEVLPKAFWLLRINGNNWRIEELSPADILHFHSHRPGVGQVDDYPLFKIAKEGDEGLAYCYGRVKAIVFRFQVTRGLHYDPHEGEVILLKITEILPVHIPIAFFIKKYSHARSLENAGLVKLFKLSEDEFKAILSETPAARTRVPRSYAMESVANIFTDNTGGKLKDQLGFESDYKALARVVAYKKFQPPLAIGLFGNWGSGKSFFMSKLKDEIQDLADDLADDKFCHRIVQINFNSWHYSDSNLWASLITKIFEDLEKSSKNKENELQSLFNNLNSAKVLIAEAQENLTKVDGQITSLSARQVKLEEEINTQKRKLDGVSYWDIAKAVFKGQQVQSSLNNVKDKMSFLKTDDLDQVQSRIMELNSESGKLKETFKLAYSFKSPKLFFALVLLVLVYWGVDWLINDSGLLAEGIKKIDLVIKGVLLILTQGMVFLRPAFQKVQQAHNELVELKKITDTKAAEQFQNEKSAIEAQMNAAQSQKTEISTTIGALEGKKAEITEELKNVQSGKKLVRFIEGRVTDARYVNSLGIISWIRKDFEQLDYLLKQQHLSKKPSTNVIPVAEIDALKEKQESLSFELDRIILYIDDLDRCDFPVVVKVLEAIHLLLAFPLFVVVVGVDPRWMHNALRQRYAGFISNENSNGEKNEEQESDGHSDDDESPEYAGVATSFDYLEKIFQIPFVLKPIDGEGKSKLIEANLKGDLYENDEPKKPQQAENGTESKKESDKESTGESSASETNEGVDKTENVTTTATATAQKKTETKGDIKSGLTKNVVTKPSDMLEIPKEEIDFMKAMAFIVGDSPRSIKRYINIYRIIRAHARFTFVDENKVEHYYAAMIILGIISNFPENANDFFAYLMGEDDLTPFHRTYENYRQEHGDDKPFPVSLLGQVTDNAVIEKVRIIKMEKFKVNLDLICRFSFRF